MVSNLRHHMGLNLCWLWKQPLQVQEILILLWLHTLIYNNVQIHSTPTNHKVSHSVILQYVHQISIDTNEGLQDTSTKPHPLATPRVKYLWEELAFIETTYKLKKLKAEEDLHSFQGILKLVTLYVSIRVWCEQRKKMIGETSAMPPWV